MEELILKEHKINHLGNFISGWYMKDTSLCDDLIDFWKTSEDKKIGMMGGPGGVPEINLEKKNSIDVSFPRLQDDPLGFRYYTHLNDVLYFYSQQYKFVNEMAPMDVVQPPNIQWYPKGGGFHQWHCERSNGKLPSATRNLVYMTYLNDIEEGGETEFYFQKLKIKPEKGLTLIWGADWTFTHHGLPAPNEEKYIITGWLNYVE